MQARRSPDGKYRVSWREGFRVSYRSTPTAADTGEQLRVDDSKPLHFIGGFAGFSTATTITLNVFLWLFVFDRRMGLPILLLTVALVLSLALAVSAITSRVITFSPASPSNNAPA